MSNKDVVSQQVSQLNMDARKLNMVLKQQTLDRQLKLHRLNQVIEKLESDY